MRSAGRRGGAAEGGGEVEADVGDVGSAQVVDGDQVGAAEGVEVDPLDAAVSIVIAPWCGRT